MELDPTQQFDSIFLVVTIKGTEGDDFFGKGYEKLLKILNSKFKKERNDGTITVWDKKNVLKDKPTATISIESHTKKILRENDNPPSEWQIIPSIPSDECSSFLQDYRSYVTTQFVFASSFEKDKCTIFFETATHRPLGKNQDFLRDEKEYVIYSTALVSPWNKIRVVVGVSLSVEENEITEIIIIEYKWTSADNSIYKAKMKAKKIFHSHELRNSDPAYEQYNKYVERACSEMYTNIKKIT